MISGTVPALPAGVLPGDPIVPALEAMTAQVARVEVLAGMLETRLDGARLLSPDEAATLGQDVARAAGHVARAEMRAILRGHLLRTVLAAAVPLLVALGGVAWVAHSWGRAGATAALCTGATVKEARGGLYCTVWITPPTAVSQR